VSCLAGRPVCRSAIGFAGLLAFELVSLTAHGQTAAPERSILKTEAVEYLYPEQVNVPSGKASAVALHFRVGPGLHINSHAPREESLIPTTLAVPEGSGVRLEAADFPPGADFILPLDPGEKLSVYTGDFVIQASIVATPGNHLVEAKLRYQACNSTQCLPPKTITVPIDVVGK
jgi:hypothetical protein